MLSGVDGGIRKIVSVLTAFFVGVSCAGDVRAQVVTGESFRAPVLTGIKVYPENPLKFDFIFDQGGARLDPGELKTESFRLIKYFLLALAIPEDKIWVNLSPYEKDRILPDVLGRTEMGRDLLAQDYILKQVAAALLYPQKETGKVFWRRVYALAKEKYGTTDIPVDVLSRVWIEPQEAVVSEDKQGFGACIIDARLKVSLEKDAHIPEGALGSVRDDNGHNDFVSDVLRDVLLPVLTSEVNEGKSFVGLRQLYHSLILSAWYKNRIRSSLLASAYVNRLKTAGGLSADPQEAQKIWKKYVFAFEKQAALIVEEDEEEGGVARRYVSGGFEMAVSAVLRIRESESVFSAIDTSNSFWVHSAADIIDQEKDFAQVILPRGSSLTNILVEWEQIAGKKRLLVQENGPEGSFLGVTAYKNNLALRFMQQAVAGGIFWREKKNNQRILFHISGPKQLDVYVNGRRKATGKLTRKAETLLSWVRRKKDGDALVYVTNRGVLDLSDIHLGKGDVHDAFSGREKELLSLLDDAARTKKVVVLNGDILELLKYRFGDVYDVRRNFFDALARCDKVFYVVGNHDEVVLRDAFLKKQQGLLSLAAEREIPEEEYPDMFIRLAGKFPERKISLRLTRARLPYGPVCDEQGNVWFDRTLFDLPFDEAHSLVKRTLKGIDGDIASKLLAHVNADRSDRMIIGRYVLVLRPRARQIFHFEHGHIPDRFNNRESAGTQLDRLTSLLMNHNWGQMTKWIEHDLFYPLMTGLIKNVPGFDLFLLKAQVARIAQLGVLWDRLLPELYPRLFEEAPVSEWKRYVVFGHTHAPTNPGEGLLGKVLRTKTAWQYINSGTWSDCKEWGRHDAADSKTFSWVSADDHGVRVHYGDVKEKPGGITLVGIYARAGVDNVHQDKDQFARSEQLFLRLQDALGLSAVILSIHPFSLPSQAGLFPPGS